MVRTHIRTRLLGVALALTLLAGPVRAGDIDPYLPADTEVLVTFNVRQILGSALIKRVGLDQIRDAIKMNEEVSTILKDLGLDPFKDIDRILAAQPATSEQDKGLVIVRGRFDLAKIRARAEKEAKDNKDSFKVQKVKDGQGGEHTIYKFQVPNPQGGEVTLYAGLASKTVILAAPSKDYLIDGLKVKPDATKLKKLKSKAFQDLLKTANDQQSLSIALVGEALTKSPLGELPIKDVLAKITAVAGGFTVTDGVKMEINVGTKEAADAKMLKEKISEGLNMVLGFLALAAANQKELAPFVDFIKSLKTTSKDKTLTLKGELPAETLNKLIPKDQ
jgi:hypothetical protein